MSTKHSPSLARPLLARHCWTVTFIGLLAVNVASAQGRGWGWGRGNYASTAQQAADYGMASMMRAQGYQNLQNSEAAKNYEQAKTLEIDNRKKWTETYFEMRKINRQARAEEPSRTAGRGGSPCRR